MDVRLIDMEELRQEIEYATERLSSQSSSNESQWLDTAEAAAYMRMSVTTLNGLQKQKSFPTYQPSGDNGKRLYSRDDLDKFLRSAVVS